MAGLSGALVLALSAAGTPGTRAELNDGGVWVTNVGASEYGRFIKSIRQQDTPGSIGSQDFDLLQSGSRVLIVDRGASAVRIVDPASTSASAPIPLPTPETTVAMGGPLGDERVVLTDRASGRFWVLPFDQVVGLTPKTEPTGTASPGAVAVVAQSGDAFVVSPEKRQLITASADADNVRLDPTELPATLFTDVAGAATAVTAVGDVPVVSGGPSGMVWTPDGSAELGSLEGAELQQAGPEAGAVLVASQAGLHSIPLSGGAPAQVGPPVQAASDPPAPVVVGGCAYAAFVVEGQTHQLRACEGNQPEVRPLLTRSGDAVDPEDSSALRYRVNRGLVVLNDTRSGAIWDPDADELRRLDTWDQLAALEQKQDETEMDDSATEQLCGKRGSRNTPPVAKDDEVGVRAGQPVVIDVLANDSDADCDVLAVAELQQPDEAQGRVELVADGRKLQFTPSDGAAGSTLRFTYTVTDGRTGGAAEAVVTVRVSRAGGENKPPQVLRSSTTVVEQGKSVLYNVLSDFVDPDGDPLFLAAASVDGEKGTVRFAPDGTITYKDGGRALGTVSIQVQVSDGQAAAAGMLKVKVKSEGNIAPTARSDYARTTVGAPVSLEPLANDSDPNEDALRLVEVKASEAKEGFTIRSDKAVGRVTVAAKEPGAYLMEYTITDDRGGDAIGRMRVDVTGRSANGPPVAMVDVVEVRTGQVATVDVLANDFDPDGDVLIVGDVEASGVKASVRASILGHRFVRLSLLRSLQAPVSLTYTLSDGTHEVTGMLIVREDRSGAVSAEPVAVEDSARARPGARISIDVLANDLDPVGEGLTLSTSLVSGPKTGKAVVNGSVIRYTAPEGLGRDSFEYRIIDGNGNRTVGRVSVQVQDPPQNSAPIAPALQARVTVGGKARIVLPLAGADPDGDLVVLDNVGSSKLGNEVSIEPGSTDTVVYRAVATGTGTDHLTYRICDLVEDRRCAQGVIRVGVLKPVGNRAPVTQLDEVTVRPDKRVAAPVLENDIDPDGDELTLDPGGLRAPQGLDVAVEGPLVTFTAPEEGSYSVTYAVTDGVNQAVLGRLSITASPQAPLRAPVARDDTIDRASLTAGQASAVIDVSANDHDPDGRQDELKVDLVDTSVGDRVLPDQTVQVTLGPTGRVVGYTVTDPDGLKGYGFILLPPVTNLEPIAVTPPPAFQVDAGKELRIELDQVVTDPDSGPEPLRIVPSGTSVRPASERELIISPTSIAYTPAADVTTDQGVINLVVTDGDATREVTVIVRINIPNRPPEFVDLTDDVEKASTESLVLDLQSSVQDPDVADRDRPATFGDLVRTGSAAIEAKLDPNGTMTVSAASDATVGDRGTFTFSVTDARGESTTGTAVISVVATRKEPPVTSNDTIERLDEGDTAVKDVIANDFDPFQGLPNAGLELVNVVARSEGVSAVEAGDGRISVTASAGFAGQAQIAYTVKDAAERTADGVLEVFVWGKPSQPGTPTEVKDGTTATSVKLTWAGSQANSYSPDPEARQLTYRVVYSGGPKECPDTTCTIDGLTPGASYSFTVTAVNAVGPSPASRPSAPIVPDALPVAPVFQPLPGKDAFGDGTVALAWSQPTFEGSRLLEYELAYSPDGGRLSVPPGATSTTVRGLRNGVTYSFTLTAVNAKGRTSSDPYSETPTALPGPPGTPVATADSSPAGRDIAVTWPAAPNGGDDAMTYTAVLYRGGSAVDTRADISGTSASFVGENGLTYTVGVTATNRKGSGPEVMSAPVTPYGAPGPVTGLTATATGADGQVQLAFSAPSETGGVPTGSLTYEVDTGSGWRPLAASRMLTGLSNGINYTIRVRAHNGEKPGDSTTTNATPYGPVPAPTVSASAAGQQVTFTWNATTNGRPITVTISVDGGGWEGVGASGSRTVSGDWSQNHTTTVRSCATEGGCKEASTSRQAEGPPPPPSNVGTVNSCNTYNNCSPARIRASASKNAAILGEASNGTSLRAYCWVNGDLMSTGSVNTTEDNARTYNSRIWWNVDWGSGRGWIADVWFVRQFGEYGVETWGNPPVGTGTIWGLPSC